MSLDEETLENVVKTGEMDYEKWPLVVEPLVQEFHNIISTKFSMPRLYPPINRQLPQSSPTQSQPRDSNPTPTTPIRNLPPVPPFPSATPTSRAPDTLIPTQDLALDLNSETLYELPAVLLQLVQSITHTLRNAFGDKPPHTVQRLAELILYPTKHYKTLPAYLRAIDRIVSVSSTADIFPLSDAPAIVNGVNGDGGGGILWNNNDTRNGYDRDSLGSDESLGGALLTPIPWLRNGTSNNGGDRGDDDAQLDSNNSGSSDGIGDSIGLIGAQGNANPLVLSREDGAVTQGELMRMEQEAGVVPLTQNPEDTSVTRTMGDADNDGLYLDEGDVLPHARGPDVVGSVDMGRVDGKDVELHIGSPPTGEETGATDPNDAQTVLSAEDSQGVPTGGAEQASTNAATAPSTSDSDDFELIQKEPADEEDVMQLDDATSGTSSQSGLLPLAQRQDPPADEQDGDIVLVDADGKADDDTPSKADTSGENVSAGAADASTLT